MDEAALLQELKDVSNRRSESYKTTINRRLSLSLTCLSSEIDSKEGENEKDLSKNVFLNKTGENRELNQYWYSRFTIDKLCDAIRESLALRNGKKVAFLSTPSLFFSLKRNERRECALFDFDKSLGSFGGNYNFYDFNYPTNIDDGCRGQFDLVVIDPPFISQSVWEKYAITAKLLMKDDKAHVIATTVDENAVLMKALFHCKPVAFRPSIPHLVYQYSVFTNFPSSTLADKNQELAHTEYEKLSV